MGTLPSTTNITTVITTAAITMLPTMMPSLAPSSWDDHYREHNDDDESSHPYPWFDIGLRFLLVVVVILLLFLRTARQRRFNSGQQQHSTTVIINGDFTMRQNGANGNTNTSNPNTAVLTLEDRVALYTKTFETNGNQLKLQPKHIVVHHKTGNNTSVDNDDATNDDAASTFVDVELGNNGDDKEDDNDDNDEDDFEQSMHLSLASARNLTQQLEEAVLPTSRDSSSSSGSSSSSSSTSSNITTATTKLCLDEQQEIDAMTNTNRTTNPTISGTCVICFEQFHKDEVIVWSEDPTCPHVYHQDCMVHFLASNAERNLTGRARRTNILDVTHNPCPTCRKNYCHVRDQDIIEWMVQKTTTTPAVLATTRETPETTTETATTATVASATRTM